MTKEFVKSEIKERIKVLIDYLEMKVKERDWHGVSDAANDIRVLEAKYEAIEDNN